MVLLLHVYPNLPTPSTYVAEILERFAAEETRGRVNIAWQGKRRSNGWVETIGRVKETGYEIIDAREKESGRLIDGVPDIAVHFEVRRRGFTGLDGSW